MLADPLELLGHRGRLGGLGGPAQHLELALERAHVLVDRGAVVAVLGQWELRRRGVLWRVVRVAVLRWCVATAALGRFVEDVGGRIDDLDGLIHGGVEERSM